MKSSKGETKNAMRMEASRLIGQKELAQVAVTETSTCENIRSREDIAGKLRAERHGNWRFSQTFIKQSVQLKIDFHC